MQFYIKAIQQDRGRISDHRPSNVLELSYKFKWLFLMQCVCELQNSILASRPMLHLFASTFRACDYLFMLIKGKHYIFEPMNMWHIFKKKNEGTQTHSYSSYWFWKSYQGLRH